MVVTGRLTDVVVLTALLEEHAAVLAAVRGAGAAFLDGGQEPTRVNIDGVSVTILPPVGMGNAPAAAEVGRAVQAWQPVYVVLVGITGGLRPHVQLGDVLVADQVVGYEQARIGPQGPEWRYEVYRPSHRLIDTARVVAGSDWADSIRTARPIDHRGTRLPAVHFGPVLSGEKVVADSRDLAAHIKVWPKARGVEMEGFGTAVATHHGDTRFILVKGVSDLADPTKDDRWHPYAAEAAARFALELIRRTDLPMRPTSTDGLGHLVPDDSRAIDRDGRLAPTLDDLAWEIVKLRRAEEESRAIHDPWRLPVRWNFVRGDDPALTNVHWAGPDGPRRVGRSPAPTAGLAEIADLFAVQLSAHRLVVLAAPGAGKSMFPLRLVGDLLESRQSGDPVPVLLPVGDWQPGGERSLAEWIADRLTQDYPDLGRKIRSATGIEETVAARLVKSGRILPVLDGLDESPDGLRAAAITALNEQRPQWPVVVTARGAEYREAVCKAGRGLSNAEVIELEPLRPNDVDRYLPAATGGPPERWVEVQEHLHDQPDGPIAHALRTPLMVWLARTLYAADRDPSELCDVSRFPESTDVEDHLLDHIVPALYPPYPLPKSRGVPHWDPYRVRKWFFLLARHLNTRRTNDLEWWELRHVIPRFGRVQWRLHCLLISCVIAAVTPAPYPGLAGVAVSILSALLFGALLQLPPVSWATDYDEKGWGRAPLLITRRLLHRPRDNNVDEGHVSKWDNLVSGVTQFIPATVLLGVAGMLAAELADRPALLVPAYGQLVLLALHLQLTCAICCLILAYVVWLDGEPDISNEELMRGEVSRATSPVSVYRTDRNTAVVLGVVVMVVGGIASFAPGEPDALRAEAVLVVAVSFWPMVLACASLRFRLVCGFLAWRGLLPWRIMTFLEDACRRGVLRKVGPVYQFRHARLQARLSRPESVSQASSAGFPGTERRLDEEASSA